MTDLKSCPYCASENVHRVTVGISSPPEVECFSCRATAESVKAWNTRHATEAQIEAASNLEHIRDAIQHTINYTKSRDSNTIIEPVNYPVNVYERWVEVFDDVKAALNAAQDV